MKDNLKELKTALDPNEIAEFSAQQRREDMLGMGLIAAGMLGLLCLNFLVMLA